MSAPHGGHERTAHDAEARPSTGDARMGPLVDGRASLEQRDLGLDQDLPALPLPEGLSVEFRELVDKTLRQDYARLHKLTHEDLPAATLSQKPHRIVNFARIARANVLRLLALYRWKVECDLEQDGTGGDVLGQLAIPPFGGTVKQEPGVAGPSTGAKRRRLGAVSKTWGIKSLLAAQDAQYTAAHSHLTDASHGVFKRRRPNPDIATAVDVLGTGSFRRWPRHLADTYERPEPKTRSDVVRTLSNLDRALAYRVAVREEMPSGLDVVGIRDGRIHLSAPGLFECALTALGDLPADLLLLDLRLLLAVKEGTTGAESFPADLTSDALDHTINVVINPILRTDDGCRIADAADSAAPKNTALCRLYNVLRNMALSYQLQVLWTQARRLERFEWKDKMRCEMSAEGAVLTITYWMPRKTQSSNNTAPNDLNSGGKIVISSSGQSHTSDAGTLGAMSLHVVWEPSRVYLGLSPEPSGESVKTFSLNNLQLDLAGLLSEVTQHHANVLIRRQHAALIRLMTDKPELRTIFATLDDFRLTETRDTVSMDVKVYQTHWLRFQINHTTGGLDVREARTAGMAALEKRIALVKNTLADAPQRLLEQVYSLKKQYVLDALETKLEYLGHQASHAMKGVPLEDLERYGLASTIAGKIRSKPFFVIQTLASPLYLLVIMLQEPGFAYAFVGVRPGPNGQMQIGHFSWLDVGRILQARCSSEILTEGRSSSFEISAASINRVYAYANAKVMMLQLELQLIGRSIPYLLVQPSAHDPMPAIQVKAVDLLADDAASETSMRNVLFSIVDWEDARACHAQTSVRLRRTAGSLGGVSQAVKAKRQHVRFDEATSTLIMTPPNIAGHIAWVETEWANVSRLLTVAGQVVKLARRPELSSVSVVDFDLEQLCCAYGHDQRVVFQFENAGGKYLLRFPSSVGGERSMHKLVEQELEDNFNEDVEKSSMNTACARFLQYLTCSFPCLRALSEVEQGCSAKVVWQNPASWVVLWTRPGSRIGFEVSLLVDARQVRVRDVAQVVSQAKVRGLGKVNPTEKIKAYMDRASALHTPSPDEMRCRLDDGAVLLCGSESAGSIIKLLAESISASAQA